METTKLELKHLAPYLLYGLKMYHKGVSDAIIKNNKEYKPTTLKALTTDGLFWVGKESSSRKLGEDIHKPILRPLYNLTNEDWKEEMTILFESVDKDVKITKYDSGNDNSFDFTLSITYKWLGDVFTEILVSRGSIKDTRYYFVEWLFKNHFDVFGLIDKGLAIDKNTL